MIARESQTFAPRVWAELQRWRTWALRQTGHRSRHALLAWQACHTTAPTALPTAGASIENISTPGMRLSGGVSGDERAGFSAARASAVVSIGGMHSLPAPSAEAASHSAAGLGSGLATGSAAAGVPTVRVSAAGAPTGHSTGLSAAGMQTSRVLAAASQSVKMPLVAAKLHSPRVLSAPLHVPAKGVSAAGVPAAGMQASKGPSELSGPGLHLPRLQRVLGAAEILSKTAAACTRLEAVQQLCVAGVTQTGLPAEVVSQGAAACTRVAAGQKLRVAVALSGGVDSAVTALRLQQQGHRVFCLFMRNWDAQEEGDDGTPGVRRESCHERDLRDAQGVADRLGLELHQCDFVRQYWDQVFSHFLAQYALGATPNPDLPCNRFIKFGALLAAAQALGAEAVATGHYAQLRSEPTEGVTLLRGADHRQDQSFFLAAVQQHTLRHYLFPLGGSRKADVRAEAERARLAPAGKRSSRGICFIGPRAFASFMTQYTQPVPGRFELLGDDLSGARQPLGPCSDLLALTVGQRVHVGGRMESSRLFVAGKDMVQGVVHVVPGAQHPALACHNVLLGAVSWVAGRAPSGWHSLPADHNLASKPQPDLHTVPDPDGFTRDMLQSALDLGGAGRDGLQQAFSSPRDGGRARSSRDESQSIPDSPRGSSSSTGTDSPRDGSSCPRDATDGAQQSGALSVGLKCTAKLAYRQESVMSCTLMPVQAARKVSRSKLHVQLPGLIGAAAAWWGQQGDVDQTSQQVHRGQGSRKQKHLGQGHSEQEHLGQSPLKQGLSTQALQTYSITGCEAVPSLEHGTSGTSQAECQGEMHPGGLQGQPENAVDALSEAGCEWVAVFNEPVFAVAPGQALVLYQGEEVLGSAQVLGPACTLWEHMIQS